MRGGSPGAEARARAAGDQGRTEFGGEEVGHSLSRSLSDIFSAPHSQTPAKSVHPVDSRSAEAAARRGVAQIKTGNG